MTSNFQRNLRAIINCQSVEVAGCSKNHRTVFTRTSSGEYFDYRIDDLTLQLTDYFVHIVDSLSGVRSNMTCTG
ncbi:MAG: hypothetical protein IPP22_15215 [Nitrosomonas sp.]|nr:hypothetical protein [Nitrosomonas sp.]